MEKITLFDVIWNALLIFFVSLASLQVGGCKKSIKEKLSIAFACVVIFTPLSLGFIYIVK
jgi:uncharacterized membrane protein